MTDHQLQQDPAGDPAAPRIPTSSSWGFPSWLPALGGLLVAIGLVMVLLTSESRDRLVAGSAMVVGAAVVLVGLRLRQRLLADRGGLTIRRFLGADLVPWADVLAVRTVAHRRWGAQSSLLELDLVDDGFLVFSGTELGAGADDVARRIRAWKSGYPLPEFDDPGF